MPYSEKGFNQIFLIVTIAIVGGVIGSVYWLLSSKQADVTIEPNIETISSQLQPVPSTAIATSAPEATASVVVKKTIPAGWTEFVAEKFSLIYPTEYKISEVRKDVYELVPSSKLDDTDALITIDASLSHNNVSFAQAFSSTKNLLHKVTTENLSNGVKILGHTIGGYGESLPRRITLINYHSGAIHIQTTTADATEIKNYDEIIASFQLN